MILSALNDYYERLLARNAEGISPLGYSQEKISYEIVLSGDGHVIAVNDIRDLSGKKPIPKMISVPASFKRTGVTPKSFYLWDKASYVLGVAEEDRGEVGFSPKTFESFKQFHCKCLNGVSDAGAVALLRFLEGWSPSQFVGRLFSQEMLTANFVFRLDGDMCFLHDRPALRKLWADMCDGADAKSGMCLVSGEYRPLVRLHSSIKGVNDAQSSGADIISFNKDSFLSYRGSIHKLLSEKKENDSSASAPVSASTAFAYTTVLNYLLRRSEHNHQRLQIGDATVVFWAQAENDENAKAAESLMEAFFNPPSDDGQETQKVRDVLDAVSKGRPLKELNLNLDGGTRVFVLGLSPNASRLSIRFWQVDTLEVFSKRLAQHFFDLQLDPLPWRTPPAIWRLLLATAPSRDGKSKSEDVSPQLAGDLTRAILTGSRYPRSLLSNIVMRLRIDGDISGVRVALCKGVLARDKRKGVIGVNEEIPVSLDPTNKEPGYLLGRLFSTLENIQRAALGKQINATIRDRYYGAASATPASVFPVLIRNAQHHLSRLRKDKPGLAVNLEKEVGEIVDLLGTNFPKSLRIEAQGKFAIGYYHQSQARFSQKEGQDAIESEEGEAA